MKNILTTLLVLLSMFGFSQTNVQLEIVDENGSEQYTLTLEREVDGKMVETQKKYSSLEEMKNDPELKDLDLQIIESEEEDFTSSDKQIGIDNTAKEDQEVLFLTDEGDEDNIQLKVWTDGNGHTYSVKNGKDVDIDELHENQDGDVKIKVTVDKDTQLPEGQDTKDSVKNGKVRSSKDQSKEGSHNFIIKIESDSSRELNEIKEVEITVDKDGTHHVKVNGEEVDYNTWKEGNNDKLPSDAKTMKWLEEGKDGKHVKKIIMITTNTESPSGKKENATIGNSRNVELHIEDINTKDEKVFALERNKKLKLDTFNFYPNPNNGTFQLKFEGKTRPTTVKITDIHGKEMYAETIQNFSGSFDKEINLSGVKRGIYLLQVVQGSRAVNKKIIIE